MMKFRLKNIIGATIILALLFFFLFAIIDSNSSVNTAAPVVLQAPVILDAGHGGQDGGAVSQAGTAEAGVNLAICLKTQMLMEFLGVKTILTRTDDGSLGFSEDATIRQNKNADLNARLDIALANEHSPFLSIHLNNFGQKKYYGAQVFYSQNNPLSATLAEKMQESLKSALDPDNQRSAKPSPKDVMLMSKMNNPAVTIECGFLSNEREEARLKDPEYQKKIALAIVSGYLSYIFE